ncbi:MAG: hypothetical protein QXG12_04045 [Thermoproteota archaeon]
MSDEFEDVRNGEKINEVEVGEFRYFRKILLDSLYLSGCQIISATENRIELVETKTERDNY